MTEAGWTSNDHAINLYTYVLGYHPDQEALEAGDDKDYNAIKRALEHSYQQGRVEGLREAAIICRERGKPHDIEWWMTASKKEVSAQTAIDCAELIEQLAQQAHGEKGVGDGSHIANK